MRIAAPLLALLVLLAGATPAVVLADDGADLSGSEADSDPDSATATPAARPVLVGPPVARIDDPIVTELYIEPDPRGSARWTVSIRYNLSSSSDRAAFDSYARDFESGDADVGPDVAFFRRLADEASRATGREMSIRNPTRNATVANGTGVLNLSFTWTNFVTDTENGFVIEDAVLMPDNRTWLASIGPSQRLIIETPPGYQVTDTRFGLDNGSVIVDGPHTFRDPLSVSYQQTSPEDPEPPSTPWALTVGALLVGLGLVAAIVYLRRRDTDGPVERGVDAASAPDADASGGENAVSDAGERERQEADTTDAERGDESGADDVDPSLLSDEERVEHLLDQNGGRMKQGRIVQETGWSDAKVSQLLSTMADDGRIEKLRLGRENLISLPDEEP